jgi:hypothetical protein
MLVDMPYKIANSLITNNLLYWIVGLRPSAGHFFFYLFVAFSTMLSMSMLYRTIGAASRSLSQAMIPSATLMLAVRPKAALVTSMLCWLIISLLLQSACPVRWIRSTHPLHEVSVLQPCAQQALPLIRKRRSGDGSLGSDTSTPSTTG